MKLTQRMLSVSKRTLIGATIFAATLPAIAAEKWKIQSHLPTGHKVFQAEQDFVDNVNVMLGGRLTLELLAGNAVVPANETIDGIGYGVIDGDITSPAYFAGRDKGFAMMADLIGGYDNWQQAFAWCEFGGGKELFQKIYDKYDIHFVGCANSGLESLVAKKPMRSVEDFKGVKIRAPQGLASSLFTKMGAVPVNMGMADIYTSMEKGVIDASDISSYSMNAALGFHDIANYPIVDFHSLPVLSMSVSKKKWNAQPADIQAIVTTAYRDLAVQINLTELVEVNDVKKADAAKGVEAIYWSDEEKSKMRKLARESWEEAAKESPLAKEAYESHVAFMKKIGLLEP